MKVQNKETTTSSNQLVNKTDVARTATYIEETSIQLSELAAKPSRRHILTATAAGAMVAAAGSGQAASFANPINPVIYIDDFARANFTTYNDWTPIVAAALASFDHLEDNLSDSPGGTIVFGPSPGLVPLTNGTYKFLSPAIPNTPQGFGIELNRTVRLVGSGSTAGNAGGRSQLVFAPGIGGIRANAAGYPISGLLGAGGFLIENLYLLGPGAGNGPAAAHGVYFNCGGRITGCSIHQFSGDGVRAYGNAGDRPTNGCDLSTISFTDLDANGGNGITIYRP